MSEYEFKYDDRSSYENNFARWYNMNCSERATFNEELYTETEGKMVFDKMYKKKRKRYGR